MSAPLASVHEQVRSAADDDRDRSLTKCCKCNAAGSCSDCSCANSGEQCVTCVPGVKRRCKNGGLRAPFTSSSASVDCTQIEMLVTNAAFQATAQSVLTSPQNEDDFCAAIANAYEIVVKWRRNLFNVPFGASGRAFVDELAALIKLFVDATPLRRIVWQAVCVACHLLLQRPNATRSASSYSQHLHRRLVIWSRRGISELLEECTCIQNHLPSRDRSGRNPSQSGFSDTVFSKLVFAGKINSAIKYISENSSAGFLNLDDKPVPGSAKTVRDILLEKHPPPQTPPPHALMKEEPLCVNPIMFERLTPDLIKDVGRHTSGSAGPSGLDAEAWKRMLTCFKQSSNRPCASLAAVAYRLRKEDLTQEDLSAFTAARLIPIDKKPGIRPIAVGKVFRRIICKSIMRVIEHDVRAAAPYQLSV